MRFVFLLVLSVGFVGCATTKELQEAPSCKVWKEQPVIGPFVMDVRDNKVVKKGQCMFYFWGCTERKTEIDTNGDIYHTGEGIFASRTKIASVRGKEIFYEKSIFDSLVSADPVQLDMDGKTAHRQVTAKLFGRSSTAKDDLAFNGACKQSEAAVGAVALWINETKK